MTEIEEKRLEEGRPEENFEIVIAVPESGVGIDIPRDKMKALIDLLDSLKWNKKMLLRYISIALRLRRLEKEYGKSFTILVKEYEKLSREEVKTRYSIQQLLEKRKKIEEDLRLYMDQYNITLDIVRKVAKIIEGLKELGLDIEDLNKALKIMKELKNHGYDIERILSSISDHESLSTENDRLRRQIQESREALEKIISEKEDLEKKLRESYGLVRGLEDLKNEVERLTAERERIFQQLSQYENKLEMVKKELEIFTGGKLEMEELDRALSEKKIELEDISRRVEELRTELSELIGVEKSTREIISKQKELSKRLELLEKEVQEKEKYGELLDGEIAAAYSILKLLQDPEGGGLEDLESLSQHIQRMIKIKRGETIAQKPLEPYFLEKTRKTLVDLIMPYVKKDFVPRWVFERVERELKALSEKRVLLEEEIASLKRSIEAKSKIEASRSVERKEEEAQKILTAISEEGIINDLKTLMEGKKARITCIYCGEYTLTNLPKDEELKELASKNWRLRFRCGRCGKTYDLPPEAILKKVRGEA